MSTDRTVFRIAPPALAIALALAALPALSPSATPPSPAPGSRASHRVDPADVVGGAWYTCPAMGIVFGLQIATGDVVGSFSTLIAADRAGCV